MIPNKFYFLLISIFLISSFKLCVASEFIEVNSRDDVLQRGLFIESEHVFYGIEQKVLSDMIEFIKNH